jgi:hypothetical protein
MVAEQVFVNCFNFKSITILRKSKKVLQFSRYLIKLSGAEAEARAENWNCGSVEPEPKEMNSH